MSTDRFTRDDYENPDAPESERRIRADHIEVRDLSYDRSRPRQLWDLVKHATFDPGYEKNDDLDPDDKTTWQQERLELYLKERPRGPGYVADFVYTAMTLPVTVYGVLINRGRGLEVVELELFDKQWGYDHDQFADAENDEVDNGNGEDDEAWRGAPTLITSDLLRRIPLGAILAQAQNKLAHDDWRHEGITDLGLQGPVDRSPTELTPTELAALERGAAAAGATRRGRPALPDELLIDVAHTYLAEATGGVGLTRRLAEHFDRPEATVRDWISTARTRGYLSKAVPGRRGASAGPNLPTVPRADGPS